MFTGTGEMFSGTEKTGTGTGKMFAGTVKRGTSIGWDWDFFWHQGKWHWGWGDVRWHCEMGHGIGKCSLGWARFPLALRKRALRPERHLLALRNGAQHLGNVHWDQGDIHWH